MPVANLERYLHCFPAIGRGNLENRFSGRLDSQIPILFNPQDRVRCEHCAGGKSETDFPSLLRREAAANPPALLPGEDNFVIFFGPQIRGAGWRNHVVDDQKISPHVEPLRISSSAAPWARFARLRKS